MWIEAVARGWRALSRVTAVAMVAGAALAVVPALADPVPLSSVAAPGSPAEATWKTQNGTEITVMPCASGQGLCGVLTWVVIPKAQADMCRTTDRAAFASLMMDYQNPDKTLKTRPILGMEMMKLTATNDPNAFTASIYNPQDGSTNNVSVWIVNGGETLRIGGACLGTVCAVTQDWPKVPSRPVSPDFTCDGGQ